MSGRIVNLRTERKARARDAARKKGAENAVRFGRSKAEKDAAREASERARRHLDGHERGET